MHIELLSARGAVREEGSFTTLVFAAVYDAPMPSGGGTLPTVVRGEQMVGALEDAGEARLAEELLYPVLAVCTALNAQTGEGECPGLVQTTTAPSDDDDGFTIGDLNHDESVVLLAVAVPLVVVAIVVLLVLLFCRTPKPKQKVVRSPQEMGLVPYYHDPASGRCSPSPAPSPRARPILRSQATDSDPDGGAGIALPVRVTHGAAGPSIPRRIPARRRRLRALDAAAASRDAPLHVLQPGNATSTPTSAKPAAIRLGSPLWGAL